MIGSGLSKDPDIAVILEYPFVYICTQAKASRHPRLGKAVLRRWTQSTHAILETPRRRQFARYVPKKITNPTMGLTRCTVCSKVHIEWGSRQTIVCPVPCGKCYLTRVSSSGRTETWHVVTVSGS
jgi:hypothetical protein